MKRERGRPESRIIKLDATPEEVAAAIFAAADIPCKPPQKGIYKEVEVPGIEPVAG